MKGIIAANQGGHKMTKKEMKAKGWTIQSGDENHEDVRCYNCGTPFRCAVSLENRPGDCIVCPKCSGRCGYIEEY